MSLKNKIFVFNFIVFIVSFTLFSFLIIKSVNTRMLENYKQSAKQELDMIQNNLDILITSSEDYLRIISTDDNLQDDMYYCAQKENLSLLDRQKMRTSIGRTVSNLIYPNTRIDGIIVWGKDETILYAGYSIQEESIYQNIEKAYLEKVEKNQKATWGNPVTIVKNEGNTCYVFPVSKIVIDKDTGYRLGKITLLLKENEIENVYRNHKTNEEIQYIILNEGGSIVSCSYKEHLGANIEETDFIEMDNLEKLREQGELVIRQNDALAMKEYERLGWQVISKRTIKEFYLMRGTIIRNTILLFLFIAIIVFAGAYTIAKKITSPLYSLINTMKMIREGDMTARTDKFQQKEIDELAQEFNILMEKLEESMNQIYIHQKNKRKNELQLLQEQIKPHFLYNALETCASLIKLDFREKAIQMLQALSGFYRKSLSNGQGIVKLKDEMEIIENYLHIQSIRYENYMDYTLDISTDILDYKIPKLVLQPLVENALYHGIKPSGEKEELVIRGYRQNSDIVIEVFDSGVGICKEKLEEIQKKLIIKENTSSGNSFGLFNVNERVRLYFGDKYGITLESMEGEYTQITVRIPSLE